VLSNLICYGQVFSLYSSFQSFVRWVASRLNFGLTYLEFLKFHVKYRSWVPGVSLGGPVGPSEFQSEVISHLGRHSLFVSRFERMPIFNCPLSVTSLGFKGDFLVLYDWQDPEVLFSELQMMNCGLSLVRVCCYSSRTVLRSLLLVHGDSLDQNLNFEIRSTKYYERRFHQMGYQFQFRFVDSEGIFTYLLTF